MPLVALLLSAGCIAIYAPKAERLSGYEHQQAAGFMDIRQDIQPRLADELAGAIGAKISGNSVGSNNKVASDNKADLPVPRGTKK